MEAEETEEGEPVDEPDNPPPATPTRPRARGLGRRPDRQLLQQPMFAVKFGEPNFLLSERVNSNSEVYNRNPRDRVEKVRLSLLPSTTTRTRRRSSTARSSDPRRLYDDRPLPERGEGVVRVDDRRLAPGEHRAAGPLSTDEMNTCGTPSRRPSSYDGTVTLYEWDEEDPILQAWRGAFPDTVKDKAEIPDDLMSHLRYPEDMFKVQRYQFARYHVTDPVDFYQGNNRWEVPEDPNHRGPPAAAVPDVRQPDRRGRRDRQRRVVADLRLRAVRQEQPGGVRLGRLRRVRPGRLREDPRPPAHRHPDARPEPDRERVRRQPGRPQQVLPFQSGGSPPLYGNLLTLPVDDGLIYIEPVYAARAGTTGGYPILQYVLVSYGGNVGIGTTLTQALGDALGASALPEGPGTTPENPDPGEDEPDPGEEIPVPDQIRDLLIGAQEAFDAAEEAQRNGNTVRWAALMEKGKDLVSEAVALSSTLPENQPGAQEDQPAGVAGPGFGPPHPTQ